MRPDSGEFRHPGATVFFFACMILLVLSAVCTNKNNPAGPDTGDAEFIFTPDSVFFGNVTFNQTISPMAVWLLNRGGQTIKIDSISIVQPYHHIFKIIASPQCPVSLKHADSSIVYIEAGTYSTGYYSAELHVRYFGGNESHGSVNIPISIHVSQPPPVSISGIPDSIVFRSVLLNTEVSDSLTYASASGMLTFNAEDVKETVNVTINGDTKYETDETFTVTLSSAYNTTMSVLKVAILNLKIG